METEEPEVAVVGTKGQIVIPQRLRKKLKISPKTKVALYTKGDKIVITKLEFPDIGDELEGLFKEVDEQNKGRRIPNEKEITDIIHVYRRQKRANQGT